MKECRVLLCLLLAVVLLPALSGCGRASDQDARPEKVDYAYASEFTELLRNSREYITVRGYEGGRLCCSQSELVGENTPEGVIPEYEGEYGIYACSLYYIDQDGNRSRVEAYRSMDPPVNSAGLRSFSSGSDLDALCFTEDGFVTLESTYASWADTAGAGDEEEESLQFEQRYYIRSFDRAGQERSYAALELARDGWLDADSACLDADGNLLLFTDAGLRAFGPDGKEAYEVRPAVDADRVLRLSDGRIAVFYEQNGRKLAILDPDSHTLRNETAVSFQPAYMIAGRGDYDLCYLDGDSFCGYRIGDTEPARLFGLTALNISGTGFLPLDVSADGTVTGTVSAYDMTEGTVSMDLVTVRRVPAESVPQKQLLRIAVLSPDSRLSERIIDFNRRNEQYRAELVDYSVYGSNQDGTGGGETVLRTEILSGNAPDILFLSDINYRDLAGRGLLEDLYPYIDRDPELSRDDFFPNVLSALEVDGKLCSSVSGFYINTVIGASSVVGETPGWTYEQFNRTLASMPEGCTAFDAATTRDDILTACLALDMDRFVDWSRGTVSFDSPAFISLLEFAASFPTEQDWENYDMAQDDKVGERLAQGKQMLVQTGSSNLDEFLCADYSQYLGGRITYIGFPTSYGSGNMFCFAEEPGYAISSACKNKEVAWQFLRTFFTRAYQEKNISCFPSRKDVFEDKAREYSTVQYLKNSDGKYSLDAKGEKIPIVRYFQWNKETGDYEMVYAASPEQVERVRQLIQTTTRTADYNQRILEIVEEQTAPYFAGQKSAGEVAKLVQSKAKLFVNEQR